MPDNSTNNFAFLGSLKFFSEIDGYATPIYYSAEGDPYGNAHDLLKSLGVHPDNIEARIYDILNKLNLQLTKDFVLKQSEDVNSNKPEHIFTLESAHRTAKLLKKHSATKFFHQVKNYRFPEEAAGDLFRYLSHDVVIRCVVFSIGNLVQVLKESLWNDGEVDEESLIKMLRRDRMITRAMRPVKGYEHIFIRQGDNLWITPHGFCWLARRMLGLTVTESIGCLASVIERGSRLISDSVFCETRVQTLNETSSKEKGKKDENSTQ